MVTGEGSVIYQSFFSDTPHGYSLLTGLIVYHCCVLYPGVTCRCVSGFYGEIYMGEIFYKRLGETSGRIQSDSLTLYPICTYHLSVHQFGEEFGEGVCA